MSSYYHGVCSLRYLHELSSLRAHVDSLVEVRIGLTVIYVTCLTAICVICSSVLSVIYLQVFYQNHLEMRLIQDPSV